MYTQNKFLFCGINCTSYVIDLFSHVVGIVKTWLDNSVLNNKLTNMYNRLQLLSCKVGQESTWWWSIFVHQSSFVIQYHMYGTCNCHCTMVVTTAFVSVHCTITAMFCCSFTVQLRPQCVWDCMSIRRKMLFISPVHNQLESLLASMCSKSMKWNAAFLTGMHFCSKRMLTKLGNFWKACLWQLWNNVFLKVFCPEKKFFLSK